MAAKRLRGKYLGLVGLTIILACGFTATTVANDSKLTDIAERLDELRQVEISTVGASSFQQRVARIVGEYEKLFSGYFSSGELESLSAGDLKLVFQATNKAVFYSGEEKYLRQLQTVLQELESNGLATDEHYRDVHKGMIEARVFAEARGMAEEHAELDLEVVPAVNKSPELATHEGPTEWAVASDRNELTQQPVNLEDGPRIIVAAHPNCHFTQDAIQDIEQDPKLSKVMENYSKWIVPQRGSLDIDAVQEWNNNYPSASMTLVVDRDEWPAIDYWGTPTFYFFDNGILKDKVVGWPKGGRAEELSQAVENLDLSQQRSQ